MAAADNGSRELTGQKALPALDFMRSDLLANTGKWRDSDVMDGSEDVEPGGVAGAAVRRARSSRDRDVYVFGRFYSRATASTTSI